MTDGPQHIREQDPDEDNGVSAVLGMFRANQYIENTGAVVIAYAWPTKPNATPQEVKAQTDLVVEVINRNWHDTLKHEMPPRAVMVDQESPPFLVIIDQVRTLAAEWIGKKIRRQQEGG